MRIRDTAIIISGIAALSLIIIGFSLAADHQLKWTSERLEDVISDIEADMRTGKLDSAREGVGRLGGEWEHIKRIWAVLIDHSEVDNVTMALARIDTLMETEKVPEALTALTEMRELVSGVPDKAAFTLANIF